MYVYVDMDTSYFVYSSDCIYRITHEASDIRHFSKKTKGLPNKQTLDNRNNN